MRIKPKNPKVLRARRIIVGGVALAAVLFVLLRPNTDSSLSTEESAPMPETAANPRSGSGRRAGRAQLAVSPRLGRLFRSSG